MKLSQHKKEAKKPKANLPKLNNKGHVVLEWIFVVVFMFIIFVSFITFDKVITKDIYNVSKTQLNDTEVDTAFLDNMVLSWRAAFLIMALGLIFYGFVRGQREEPYSRYERY